MCDSRVMGHLSYACEFSKSFMRCFPLTGALVAGFIVGRSLLQQRIYYGLLKRGAMLDFQNTGALDDPLFFILVMSFLMGISHFAMDFWIYGFQLPEQEFLTNYVVPSVFFLLFVWSSYDLEAKLVPMNKYFEENPTLARKALAVMPFLDEREVQKVIPRLSLKTSDENTTLHEVYLEIKQMTREAPQHERHDILHGGGHNKGISYLLSTMWPSRILMDPKLTCDESRSFRHVRKFTAPFISTVLCSITMYICFQLGKDCMDVHSGQYEDLVSVVILSVHLACALRVCIFEYRRVKRIGPNSI